MNIMKKLVKVSVIASLFLFINMNMFAQNPSLTVLNMDSQGLEYTPVQLGNLLRMEVEKLDKFEVMDRYDVSYLIEKNKLQIDNCYGKICLVEIGKLLKTDKMMSGSVELYGDKIILSLRLVDVKTEKIEKAKVKEFLKYPNEIQTMIRISLYEMFEMPTDAMANQIKSLTNEEQYENKLINPNQDKLNLSGPRLGLTFFEGQLASIMQAEKWDGGYGMYPVAFMFGYQFEIQYLNSGNFQALFEFIPTVTGVDQGRFMPNLSVLMGFRHNVRGWEIALGPTAGLAEKAKGYYTTDAEGKTTWHLSNEWNESFPNPNHTYERVDSRGDITYHTGFVLAFGKSFKSGRMNYPVNAFVIPSKSGWRAGITFGFNAKNKQYK